MINKGVSQRRKNKTNQLLHFWAAKGLFTRKECSVCLSQRILIPSLIVTSLFTILLAGIRTSQILREKVDCKQSTQTLARWASERALKVK